MHTTGSTILLVGALLIFGLPTVQAAPGKNNDYKNPFVTDQPPAGLTLRTNLSAKERRENFERLWTIIDTEYADFILKSIDWAEVHRRYRAKLDTLAGDDDFYLMMLRLVNELKDTHSLLEN